MNHKVEITIEGAEVLNYIEKDDRSTESDSTYCILVCSRQKEDGSYPTFNGRHVLEAAAGLAQVVVDTMEDPETDIQEVIKRIGQLLDWGWIDIYPLAHRIDIADHFMLDAECLDDRTAFRLAQDLEDYLANVKKRTGVEWHFLSAGVTSTGRTWLAKLVASGGRIRNLYYHGGWHIRN